jgi:hypothetical protein
VSTWAQTLATPPAAAAMHSCCVAPLSTPQHAPRLGHSFGDEAPLLLAVTPPHDPAAWSAVSSSVQLVALFVPAIAMHDDRALDAPAQHDRRVAQAELAP